MNRTKIEWGQNPDGSQGYTWNPITGCLNGCPYCYARKLANGRLKQRYLANLNIVPMSYTQQCLKGVRAEDPFYPRFWPERMEELVKRNNIIHRKGLSVKPISIFVCDMSDLFGIGIPDKWTGEILDLIDDNDYDRFYLLTKQPQNLIKWSPFPKNCFVGVTATNPEQYRKAIVGLAGIKSAVKYISFEPLLEYIPVMSFGGLEIINWIISGAQTKPYKPPEISWLQEIVEAADGASVAVFLKDNLRPLLVDSLGKKLITRQQFFVGSDGYGGNLRQEMPKEVKADGSKFQQGGGS